MTSPNMASLVRSLQNFSIDNINNSNNSSGITAEPSSYTAGNQSSILSHSSVSSGYSSSSRNADLSSLQLHSETPLPYFWEQCLDLKTGEVYYINWRTGMRSDEDPRTNPEIINTEYYNYSEDEEDSCSYDSEGYSSSYSDNSSPLRSVVSNEKDSRQYKSCGGGGGGAVDGDDEEQVLVVTGCKNCFMYFMVPKKDEECPKCCGQLLHFDR